jgi:hypothetical protein
MTRFDYDVRIIGSRFGGTIAVLRRAANRDPVGVMLRLDARKADVIPAYSY